MMTVVATDVIQRLRQEGASRFAELGWPTTRLEEWKYTNLAPVGKIEWKNAPSAGILGADADATLVGLATVELIFINGYLATMTGEAPAGVALRDFASSAEERMVEEHLGRYAGIENAAMTALNAANMQDGAVIEIAPNTQLSGFIHLLFIGDGDGVWSHPRNLIIAGRGSSLTVIETFIGSGRHLSNAVTEIVAADGAVVDHYKIVRVSNEAFHVGTVAIHQERSSNVTSRNISVGGAIVRNDIRGALTGPGATLALEGLFVATGTQHTDSHTVIEHISPQCDSHELYKGVLDGKGRGVFDGRIVVHKNAQKTVSRQENRNLLLSETAIIDSKPTLEIHNDDVKCNHGSTIGQLEDEPMFYLRSRGLSEEDARSLLVYAFAGEMVDRMKIEPVREQVRRAMFQHMPGRMPERRERDR
jgi:Fe-S cluster assembly protein SufD